MSQNLPKRKLSDQEVSYNCIITLIELIFEPEEDGGDISREEKTDTICTPPKKH